LWIKCGQTARQIGYGGNVEEDILDNDIRQALVADVATTGTANAKNIRESKHHSQPTK
jgi:hypothetical protein